MPYFTDGSLVSGKLQIDDSDGWDTQSEWEAYQSATSVEIVSGAVQLAELEPPDSTDLHSWYDWTEASGTSSVTDQTGNGHDLSGTYTGPTGSINSLQAGRFDGADDLLSAAWATEGQANTMFAVIKPLSVGGTWWDSAGSQAHQSYVANTDEWGFFAGSGISGGTVDTSPHILAILADGASSIIRVDGTQVASGGSGTDGFDGINVGANRNDGNYGNFDIGEFLFYPQNKSAIFGDVESYLSNKWGITI